MPQRISYQFDRETLQLSNCTQVKGAIEANIYTNLMPDGRLIHTSGTHILISGIEPSSPIQDDIDLSAYVESVSFPQNACVFQGHTYIPVRGIVREGVMTKLVYLLVDVQSHNVFVTPTLGDTLASPDAVTILSSVIPRATAVYTGTNPNFFPKKTFLPTVSK